MPPSRTRLVTRFGVSVLNVVATIETPISHQGAARPDAKNSAVLDPSSNAELDRVVKFMNDVPRAAGVLEGHTDSVGGAAANLRLSQRRADAVRQYLLSKGIDGSRLKAAGYGETRPEADNETAEGRAKNRRVLLQRTDTQ